MQLKILITVLIFGLWAATSTCQAQQWVEYPADNSGGQPDEYPLKTARRLPEEQIIKKEFEVTTQWQTITFEKSLQINRKGLMGLHLAVDQQLYISTMYNHPLNPECTKAGCAINAFCLRRLSDGTLIRPEAILVGDDGSEVKIRPAGHLYPYFDKKVITMALRAYEDADSHSPPFPEGIKAFKALRIRSTAPFRVKFLYWNVDRYPFYEHDMK
jgi:hypothetical protein